MGGSGGSWIVKGVAMEVAEVWSELDEWDDESWMDERDKMGRWVG